MRARRWTIGKSTPKAPDPAQTIAAQATANKQAITESAKVNAVDQYGPTGSTIYQKDKQGVPTSQTVSLTPTGQQTYDKQEQIAAGLTNKAGELAGRIPTGPMDISGLPARQTSIADAGAVPRGSPVPVANGAMAGQAGLTTGVNVPALQMAVASRAGELQRDIDARTSEVSNLGMGDYSAATKATQDATFGKAQSLLQPGQQLDSKRLEQSLSDRGIPLDSAAGRAELTRMQQSQSEANNRSAYDAVAAGSAEQSRLFGLDATRTSVNNSAAGQRFGQDLGAGQFRNSSTESAFGQDLSSGQFANQAAGQLFGMNMANAQLNNSAQGQAFGQNMSSQQAQFGQDMASQQAQFGQNLTSANFTNDQRTSALQEQLGLRNQDFNEASALLQGAPVMGTPSFMNTPTYGMQPVDVAGITQQNYANKVQAAQANNPMSGLFGLGSAAITAFSDREMKEDIGSPTRILDAVKALPVYSWRYQPQHGLGTDIHVGPMAQDWHAATGLGNGRTINLLDAFGVCLQAIKDLSVEVDDLKARAA